MSLQHFRYKNFFSTISIAVSTVACTVMFPSQVVHAAEYPGWKTVGTQSNHSPKYVFDVPSNFQVDATVRNRLPKDTHTTQELWEEMSAAALGSHCPNWTRSLAFLESLDDHQPIAFPTGQGLIDYAKAIMKQQLTTANINTDVSASTVQNFDAHGHPGKRVDVAAYYDANHQTCNAHFTKLTVVEIGTRNRFVFFRDQDVTGALPEHTAENLIKTLRQA